MAALPPEIWSHIVRYTNMPDWINLSRVSKDLQRMAEKRIYFSLYVRDPQIASAISHALTVRRAFRGKYVRRFWFWMDSRLANRTMELEMSEAFWEEMQRAFAAMVNLEVLSLHDPDASNSWVLDTPNIKFQLIELYVGFAWDAHFVQFLQTQSRLRMLQADETVEDGPLHSLAPGSLPSLSMFTGPALILSELLDSPLTHVQIMLEEETLAVLPGVIYDLGRAKTKLRSINVLHAPEALMMEVVRLLSKSNLAQTLRYLGIIPLPVLDRFALHRALMQFTQLEVLDVNISSWIPQPFNAYQRVIAAELLIWCPSLHRIGFWIGPTHYLWSYRGGEWANPRHVTRADESDLMWRFV